MAKNAADLDMLVNQERGRISDNRVLTHIQRLRVEPEAILRDWHYGKPGERYICWSVLEDPEANLGIAYCESGFGPSCPWGLVSVAGERRDMSIGMDCEWFPSLLGAYFESLASALPIWRVFKRVESQPKSQPGVPITEENAWDETWKLIMELREKDPSSRYDCGHSIECV